MAKTPVSLCKTQKIDTCPRQKQGYFNIINWEEPAETSGAVKCYADGKGRNDVYAKKNLPKDTRNAVN